VGGGGTAIASFGPLEKAIKIVMHVAAVDD